MKKILFFAASLAGLLFAASCQQEMLEPVSVSNTVTFTVEAPGVMNTKGTINTGATIADGTNVNEVHYAVYKTNSGEDYSIDNSGEIDGPLAQGVVPMNNKRATINFDLLQDQNFTVIFWAQVKGTDHYTLGDLRTIKMATSVAGNDESRAAFFARYDFNTYEHKDHSVTLKRPFAQLNLLTTAESLTPVQTGQTTGYTIDVKTSEVVVNGLSAEFNTLTGVAPAADDTFVFEMAESPEEQGQETLTVNGKAYHYVSMNYFFVPEEEKLVDIKYSVVTDKGSIKNEIVAVPVKENHRTNVIGNLLTKESTFTIIVDERFDQPDEEISYGVAEEPAFNEQTNTWSIVKAANVLWLASQPKDFAKGKSISFDADIDMMGQTISPIFLSTASVTVANVLGNGHKVSNFIVTAVGKTSAGLFGDHHGNITDLHVENVVVNGEYKAAALVGSIYGNVQNCSVKNAKVVSVPYFTEGSYDGGNHVGALIGYASEGGKSEYLHTGNVVDGAEVKAYRNVAGLIGTIQYGVRVEKNEVKNVRVILDQLTNFYGNEEANAGKLGGRVSASATISNNNVTNVTVETVLPEWAKINGVKTLDLGGNVTLYDGQLLCDTREFAEDYVIDGNGATVNFVADDADDFNTFITFSSVAKNHALVKDITFAGEYYFMATGYQGSAISSETEKQYFTTLENVNIIDAKVMPAQVAQALFCDGVTVLNNCNIHGTQLSSYASRTVKVFDVATFNYSHTTIDGGKYGVVGCTSGWPQATLVVSGAEIGTIENYYRARPRTNTRPDSETRGLYVKDGSKINTINTYGASSASSWTQLHIEAGAQVETLVFDANAVNHVKFTSEYIKIADGTVNKVIANGTEMTLADFKSAYNL